MVYTPPPPWEGSYDLFTDTTVNQAMNEITNCIEDYAKNSPATELGTQGLSYKCKIMKNAWCELAVKVTVKFEAGALYEEIQHDGNVTDNVFKAHNGSSKMEVMVLGARLSGPFEVPRTKAHLKHLLDLHTDILEPLDPSV